MHEGKRVKEEWTFLIRIGLIQTDIYCRNRRANSTFSIHIYTVLYNDTLERDSKFFARRNKTYIKIKKTNWWFGKRFSKIEHSMEQMKTSKETKKQTTETGIYQAWSLHTHTETHTRKYIWAIEKEEYNIYNTYIYIVYIWSISYNLKNKYVIWMLFRTLQFFA